MFQIKSTHVLFMPDSARIHTKKTLEKMMKIMDTEKHEIVAATFKASKPTSCLNAHINPREWVSFTKDSKYKVNISYLPI